MSAGHAHALVFFAASSNSVVCFFPLLWPRLLIVYAVMHERGPFLAFAPAAGDHAGDSVSAHGLFLTCVVDFDLKDTRPFCC